MFDSYGGESDAEGGPGFTVSWRGGEADYDPWRLDVERPWALHETPVSGDRDGYETPDPPPENVELARDQVVEIFASLTEKQRFVLKLSWGLDGNRQYSFREIAALMGVSWQAVQGIHERAIATIRRGYVE
ncbi:MAG TPA: sigma factor-like helix-turn-helix DNA-binding protein [Gaiellaceae bacterium]|jgi:DNA-directed RNA polymerase specialized sigma subunit|nr:sigma factor-like helix-turn-helix DNA-binding protein [Gaiellaceae bacterium]